jgi:hypothetical protein
MTTAFCTNVNCPPRYRDLAASAGRWAASLHRVEERSGFHLHVGANLSIRHGDLTVDHFGAATRPERLRRRFGHGWSGRG